MEKDDAISVRVSEVHSADSSEHPVTRQHATHTTLPDLPAQWPAEPHPLAPEPKDERWLLAYDIALCVIPFALMAKAILCIVASVIDRVHSGYAIDEVSNLTLYLIKFNQQLTTLFTVVFILIITTVVRRLALYKAQEGDTIAKLEQLQASISLPGTLRAIWSLRSFKSRTSAILLIIWAYYYLGSQATTAEYGYRPSSASHKLPMIYFSAEKPSLFYSNDSTVKVSGVDLSHLNSMYNIFSTIESDSNPPVGSDLNGGALVPYLWADGSPGEPGGYLSPKLRRDRHGYYDVSKSSEFSYTSWVGMTIFPLLPGKNTGWVINGMQGDYSSNASYFNVSCTIMGKQNASSFPSKTDPQTQISINMTSHADPRTLESDDTPAGFDIWARLNNTSSVMRASCNLQQIAVQMKVSCTAGKCVAKKMRFPPNAVPINRTVFDHSSFSSAFFNNFLYSGGVPDDYNPTYIGFNGLASNIFSQFGDLVAHTYDPSSLSGYSLPLEQQQQNAPMSVYLTQVINTYYLASLDPYQGSSNDPLFQTLTPNLVPSQITSPDWAHSTFKGNIYEPHYVLSIPWVVVDLISCQILLAAAVFAFWLRKKTLAPDIFGYVSSLTRDNPHLSLPDGGSTMSGLERARLLRKVRVRLADVADGSGVGKVGLSYAGPSTADVQMAHLKRDRNYV